MHKTIARRSAKPDHMKVTLLHRRRLALIFSANLLIANRSSGTKFRDYSSLASYGISRRFSMNFSRYFLLIHRGVSTYSPGIDTTMYVILSRAVARRNLITSTAYDACRVSHRVAWSRQGWREPTALSLQLWLNVITNQKTFRSTHFRKKHGRFSW